MAVADAVGGGAHGAVVAALRVAEDEDDGLLAAERGSSGAEASAAAAFLAGAFFAGAALAVAAVLPATAACVARVFALAAADVSVFAAVPPVAAWTLAFAASLAFAAPLAALTSFARPVTPGAVVAGVGAGPGPSA